MGDATNRVKTDEMKRVVRIVRMSRKASSDADRLISRP